MLVPERGTSHPLIPSLYKFQSTMLDNAGEAHEIRIVYIFTDPGFYTIMMIVNVMQEGQFTFIDFLDLGILMPHFPRVDTTFPLYDMVSSSWNQHKIC